LHAVHQSQSALRFFYHFYDVNFTSMIKIYHNPRCAKSREALHMLEEKGIDHQVIKYMDESLTSGQLQALLDKLAMDPFELIRTNEQIWKNEFADKDMDDNELILTMIEFPQLMQRPIIEDEDRAIVARPPELINEMI
jgi:arsenate reductase